MLLQTPGEDRRVGVTTKKQPPSRVDSNVGRFANHNARPSTSRPIPQAGDTKKRRGPLSLTYMDRTCHLLGEPADLAAVFVASPERLLAGEPVLVVHRPCLVEVGCLESGQDGSIVMETNVQGRVLLSRQRILPCS